MYQPIDNALKLLGGGLRKRFTVRKQNPLPMFFKFHFESKQVQLDHINGLGNIHL